MGADSPRHELDEQRAQALLKQACSIAGLDADGARLLRLGSNAVYHLSSPVVARIARQNDDLDAVRRSVAVARWLASIDYPAVRALDIDQPVTIDGHAVTFWQSVSDDGDQYATVAEVAEVLARLHKLETPSSLHLPPLEPFANAGKRIKSNKWLGPDDRTFLTEELARFEKAWSLLDFVLPAGVIHGDAGIGNVLHDRYGRPVVIDLDGFAIGPREWDLALTAIYYDSFGWHTRQEYETFVSIYGCDIRQWAGYPTMRATREFLMITWVIQKALEHEQIAAEARKRITALRDGSSRRDWQPY